MRKDRTTNTEAETTASREYRSRQHALNVALMATTALLSVYAAQSPALSQTRPAITAASARPSFNIPAQPLSQALVQFSTASGVQVFVNAGVVSGINSPGASGAPTPAVALNRLLAGTGLTYRFTNANTVAIERPGATTAGGAMPAGAIALDTIDVQGAGNPNSTMTLMPAYAGGQVATGGQLGMLGNRSVMNTPFSQTSYTAKLIQDQQARTVQDVLANDPSVVTTSVNSVNQEFDTIRGFSGYATNAFRNLNGLAGMAPAISPSADYIDRIEVLKGPSALLNGMAAEGSGTTGGTINLITKKAGDEPLTQLTTRYISRSQLGAHVDLGRRFGENKEFGVRFNGTLSKGDTAIDPQRSQNGSAALNIDYRGERVRLSADVMHQSNDVSPSSTNRLGLGTVTVVPRAPDASKSLIPSWNRFGSKTTLGMIRGEVDVLENVTAYAAIGAQDYNFLTSRQAFATLLNADGSYNLAVGGHRVSTKVLSMEGGIRGKVATGPVDHALSSIYRERDTTTRTTLAILTPILWLVRSIIRCFPEIQTCKIPEMLSEFS